MQRSVAAMGGGPLPEGPDLGPIPRMWRARASQRAAAHTASTTPSTSASESAVEVRARRLRVIRTAPAAPHHPLADASLLRCGWGATRSHSLGRRRRRGPAVMRQLGWWRNAPSRCPRFHPPCQAPSWPSARRTMPKRCCPRTACRTTRTACRTTPRACAGARPLSRS